MSRDIEIDIAKSLGMGMIVFGHLSGFGMGFEWLAKFFYVFHVPMFFIFSGMFLKPETSVSRAFLLKFEKVYIPYLLSNVLCLLLLAWKENVDGLPMTLFRVATGQYVVPYVGPTWFLFVLFVASLLFLFSLRMCKGKDFPICLLSVVFLAIGAKMKPFNYCGQILVAFPFLNIGFLMRKYGIKQRLLNFSDGMLSVVFVLSVAVTALLSKFNPIEIWGSQYGDLLLLCVGAVAGTTGTLIISHYLSKVPYVNKLLSFIGKNTLCILIAHIIIIQGVFLVHGQMIEHSIPMCNAPMWFWYSMCFILSMIVPAFLQKIVSFFFKHENPSIS